MAGDNRRPVSYQTDVVSLRIKSVSNYVEVNDGYVFLDDLGDENSNSNNGSGGGGGGGDGNSGVGSGVCGIHPKYTSLEDVSSTYSISK